jgi:arylsulfatase A
MGGRLRGFKRSMYEGGLRQACLARWPGAVPAGRVCDDPWAFWDVLPTCAELTGAKPPAGVPTDGLSVLPLLKGGDAPRRDYFYWELHEGGGTIQAVRFGDWKAVRNGPSRPVELYDLKADAGEKTDLAAKHPDPVAKAVKLMADARTDHPDWPLRDRPAPRKKKG